MLLEWFKSEIEEIKTLFRKHDFVDMGETYTLGKHYQCRKCKEEYYLPFDWIYRINMKKQTGCKGEKKCSISHMN